MTFETYEPPTVTRGDLEPDLEVIIGDAAGVADFSAVTPEMVDVYVTQGTVPLVQGQPDTVESLDAGKRLRVVREWVDGETDVAGRCWVNIVVHWPTARPQTFPEDTPLRLNIRKAPGDD